MKPPPTHGGTPAHVLVMLACTGVPPCVGGGFIQINPDGAIFAERTGSASQIRTLLAGISYTTNS
jgi:hypothetical protein